MVDYFTLAKSIIGQCEVGDLDVVVFVQNHAQTRNLIDVVAGYQHTMGFEGFKPSPNVLLLFGKKVHFIINRPGACRGMKINKRVFNIDG